jgi:type IV pilus assembly protein PilB
VSDDNTAGEVVHISSIPDILLSEGIINEEQAAEFITKSKQTDEPVIALILESGVVTKNELIKYIAKAFNVDYVDLADWPLNSDHGKIIQQQFAKKYNIVPIHVDGSKLTVAVTIDDAMNLELNDDIRRSSKFSTVIFVVAPEEDIDKAINELYRVDDELQKITSSANGPKDISSSHVDAIDDTEAITEESDVERFVRLTILQGITDRASDIIFEAEENRLLVRYRIDGVFHNITEAPKIMTNEIISVIKLLSSMDISIRKRAQDGSMSVMYEGTKVDLRVNILPIMDGENVTMRVLDNTQANLSLDQLGFSANNLARFRAAIKKPYGMVLVTGPTGSGKSVTLYSGLKEIANPGVNTLTIEDPIEYRVPYVKQSALSVKAGWTYPEAIRAFMRAAPNNILVGEIRDLDTASVAMQAGMTGHLVLSTLHTNSSSEVPARLADLGVQPHITSSTLSAMVAQRLIRRLCSKCKESYYPEADELLAVEFTINGKKWEEGDEIPKLYKPHKGGCKDCSGIGFRGRTAAHEVLLVDDTIRHLISSRAESYIIEAKAIENGMTKMIDDGWVKVLEGITTIPEVLKSII